MLRRCSLSFCSRMGRCSPPEFSTPSMARIASRLLGFIPTGVVMAVLFRRLEHTTTVVLLLGTFGRSRYSRTGGCSSGAHSTRPMMQQSKLSPGSMLMAVWTAVSLQAPESSALFTAQPSNWMESCSPEAVSPLSMTLRGGTWRACRVIPWRLLWTSLCRMGLPSSHGRRARLPGSSRNFGPDTPEFMDRSDASTRHERGANHSHCSARAAPEIFPAPLPLAFTA